MKFTEKDIFVVLHHRSNNEDRAKLEHCKLRTDIATEYLASESSKESWRGAFEFYSTRPRERNWSILDDLDYLERKGLFKIGKYDILLSILGHAEVKGIDEIKKRVKNINSILATGNSSNGMFTKYVFSI